MTVIQKCDRTPFAVKDAMASRSIDYPLTTCMSCKSVIRMGFFFDAFGRHRDRDDAQSSMYSSISRLWEAHRHIDDDRMSKTEHWYRFYYSGLGTPLNEDANTLAWLSASHTAGKIIRK